MTFELGTQDCIIIHLWIFFGFQQRKRQDYRKINNDTFYRPPVTSAQCIIETDSYPDSAILLNYNDDDFCQEYGQTNEAFRALTKNDILQPYISDDDFRSTTNVNDMT